MAPFDLATSLGPVAYALVFGAIGFGFGAALEMGGFGDTRKLAGQFYFQDMTVLKVMFTGIAVAAVLVALATGFGLLDMSRVFVNPTYLWPGIVGGLIMGVGFVIGGFCPGTSIVAASTLKVDGMFFLLGALGGVWLFGETVGRIVVSVGPEGESSLATLCRTHRVPLAKIGTTGGARITLAVDGQPLLDAEAAELKALFDQALETALG